MSPLTYLIVLCAVFSLTHSGKLPSYIKACKRSDSNLNQCAKESGQIALPSLMKGDPSLKIPVLDPLLVDKVDINPGNLRILLHDVKIYGFPASEIQDVNIDLEKKTMELKVHIPVITLDCQYKMDGKILILPIKGHGPANITIVGGTFTYSIDFDIVERKGKEYVQIQKSKIDYGDHRTYLQFDNLFDGDKKLADEMNNFINENWVEVAKDVKPAIQDTIIQIIESILSNIMKIVPYADIFPE